MKVKIETEDIQEVKRVAEHEYGFLLTDDQAVKLLTNRRLASQYLACGMNGVTSETVGDVLADMLFGSVWPMFDTDADFKQSLRRVGKAKGFTVSAATNEKSQKVLALNRA